MSPTRRDAVLAVLMSGAVAAVSDLRPPTIAQATEFIGTAIQRHHAPVAAGDDQRAWTLATEFSGCSMTTRTSHEVRRLGGWVSRSSVADVRLGDIEAAAVGVTQGTRDGGPAFVVTLRCDDQRACVQGASPDDHLSFDFKSELIARQVAAAFRHASTLCDAHRSAGE